MWEEEESFTFSQLITYIFCKLVDMIDMMSQYGNCRLQITSCSILARFSQNQLFSNRQMWINVMKYASYETKFLHFYTVLSCL